MTLVLTRVHTDIHLEEETHIYWSSFREQWFQARQQATPTDFSVTQVISQGAKLPDLPHIMNAASVGTQVHHALNAFFKSLTPVGDSGFELISLDELKERVDNYFPPEPAEGILSVEDFARGMAMTLIQGLEIRGVTHIEGVTEQPMGLIFVDDKSAQTDSPRAVEVGGCADLLLVACRADGTEYEYITADFKTTTAAVSDINPKYVIQLSAYHQYWSVGYGLPKSVQSSGLLVYSNGGYQAFNGEILERNFQEFEKLLNAMVGEDAPAIPVYTVDPTEISDDFVGRYHDAKCKKREAEEELEALTQELKAIAEKHKCEEVIVSPTLQYVKVNVRASKIDKELVFEKLPEAISYSESSHFRFKETKVAKDSDKNAEGI